MKSEAKLIVLVLIIIMSIVGIACFVNKSSKDENVIYNNINKQLVTQEDKISEIKKIDNFEIFNSNISVESGITTFKGYIKNISDETKNNVELDIEILGDGEEVLGTLTINIEKIEPNGIKTISSQIWKSMQNAKDFRVIEK